jgi:hypothetical protein
MTVSVNFSTKEQFFYSENHNRIELVKYVGNQNALEVPSTIDGIEITAIQDYCFEDCLSLSKVTLPDCITSLGEGVFHRCLNLESIALSTKISILHANTFANCVNLKEIIMPTGICAIDRLCFRNNYSLRHVTVPGTVNRLEDFTFSSLLSLESITIEEGVKEIGIGALFGCSNLNMVILPDSVRVLDTNCFGECKKLTKINLPKNLETINKAAFQNCIGLEEICLPEYVLTVDETAFEGCKGVKRAVWKGKFSSVDFWPTKGSYTLEDIEFGNNVSEINIHETYGSLKRVQFPSGLKKLAYSIFSEYFANQSKDDYVVLSDSILIKYKGHEKHVILPQNITELLDSCFGESVLSSIVFNENIKEIPQRCFHGCKNLAEIRIPETVYSIKREAFSDCMNLKKVIIPEGVREIQAHAFTGCPLLGEVTLPNTLERIENNLFNQELKLESFTIPPLLEKGNITYEYHWNSDVPFCFHASEIHFSNERQKIAEMINMSDTKRIYFHGQDGKINVFDTASVAEKYRSLLLPTLIFRNGNFEFDIFSIKKRYQNYSDADKKEVYTDYLKEYVIDAHLDEFISKKTDLASFDPAEMLNDLIINEKIESIEKLLANKSVRIHIGETVEQFMEYAQENRAVAVTTILMNMFYSNQEQKSRFEL